MNATLNVSPTSRPTTICPQLGVSHVPRHAMRAQAALATLAAIVLDQVACPTVPAICRLQRRADVLHAVTACTTTLFMAELAEIAIKTQRDIVVTRAPVDQLGMVSVLFDVLIVDGDQVHSHIGLRALIHPDRFGIRLVPDNVHDTAFLLDADGLTALAVHPLRDTPVGDRARAVMQTAASIAATMAGTA